MKKPPLSPYVDEGKAADFLDLERGTLANMRSQRRGPPYHRLGGTKGKPGRTIRYRLSDLVSWAERDRVDPEAGGER